MKDKTLWFTDCQYLNDMSEFVYIREPFIEAYKSICDERGELTDNIEAFADYFCRTSPYKNFDLEACLRRDRPIGRGYLPQYRYYVICASCDHDTASMWNYYVKNEVFRGYNLGLDIGVIHDWFSELRNFHIRLVHGKVICNKRCQVEMIYKKLQELYIIYDKHKAKSYINSAIEDPAEEEFRENLSVFINEKKLFFKHPSFASEKEYRFILKVHTDFRADGNLKTKFRVGSSGIITPYIEWKFDNLKPMLLKQITLSPMIEEELAKESFKRFLRDDVFQSISIVPSSIKLRF